MTRIWTQVGESTAEDMTHHTDPVEVEAAYWRAVVTRTPGPAAFMVAPGPGHDLLVDAARYRLDRRWRGPREQDQRRWARLWAAPLDGAGPWEGVPSTVLRGLLAAAGWTQAQAAQAVGVDARTMRRYLTHGTPIPWVRWVVLRDAALAAMGGER